MKKVLWMLVAVAMLGFGAMAKDQAAGGDKPAHKPPVTVSGIVKVDGDTITITADDADKTVYTVKSRNPKALEDLKAKDGQKAEVKGMVKEDGGKKTLFIGGGHGKKKEATGDAAK